MTTKIRLADFYRAGVSHYYAKEYDPTGGNTVYWVGGCSLHNLGPGGALRLYGALDDPAFAGWVDGQWEGYEAEVRLYNSGLYVRVVSGKDYTLDGPVIEVPSISMGRMIVTASHHPTQEPRRVLFTYDDAAALTPETPEHVLATSVVVGGDMRGGSHRWWMSLSGTGGESPLFYGNVVAYDTIDMNSYVYDVPLFGVFQEPFPTAYDVVNIHRSDTVGWERTDEGEGSYSENRFLVGSLPMPSYGIVASVADAAGTLVDMEVGAGHGLVVGEEVALAGFTNAAYNRLVVVTAVGVTTFTCDLGVAYPGQDTGYWGGRVLVTGNVTAVTDGTGAPGGAARFAVGADNPFLVGDFIVLKGFSEATYNGLFTVALTGADWVECGVAYVADDTGTWGGTFRDTQDIYDGAHVMFASQALVDLEPGPNSTYQPSAFGGSCGYAVIVPPGPPLPPPLPNYYLYTAYLSPDSPELLRDLAASHFMMEDSCKLKFTVPTATGDEEHVCGLVGYITEVPPGFVSGCADGCCSYAVTIAVPISFPVHSPLGEGPIENWQLLLSLGDFQASVAFYKERAGEVYYPAELPVDWRDDKWAGGTLAYTDPADGTTRKLAGIDTSTVRAVDISQATPCTYNVLPDASIILRTPKPGPYIIHRQSGIPTRGWYGHEGGTTRAPNMGDAEFITARVVEPVPYQSYLISDDSIPIRVVIPEQGFLKRVRIYLDGSDDPVYESSGVETDDGTVPIYTISPLSLAWTDPVTGTERVGMRPGMHNVTVSVSPLDSESAAVTYTLGTDVLLT